MGNTESVLCFAAKQGLQFAKNYGILLKSRKMQCNKNQKRGMNVKKVGLCLLCLVLLCGFAACNTATGNEDNAPSSPPDADYVYDMTTYDYFAQIFHKDHEKPWQTMGRYTLGLTGLGTDVVVAMDNLTVVSVTAFGRTQEVNLSPFQEDVNADIDACDGAVVVRDTEDYCCTSWIITKDAVFNYTPNGDISTAVYVDDKGVLRYRTFWGEYDTSFNHWDTAPLDLCTSRTHFLEERGTVTLTPETAILHKEKTLVLSDVYDVDAMFAEAKRNGMYEAYDTVDALFAANMKRAEESQ